MLRLLRGDRKRRRKREQRRAEATRISSSAKTFAESGTEECLVAGSSGAYQLAALCAVPPPRSAILQLPRGDKAARRDALLRSSNVRVIYPQPRFE